MLKLDRDQLCWYVLSIGVGASALGAGALHISVLATSGALMIASGVLAATHRGPSGQAEDGGWRLRECLGVGTWLALAAFSLLQVVPLPLAWAKALAPGNADVWIQALQPFDSAPPELISLSLAPGRGVVEALRAALYGVVFGTSLLLARRLGPTRLIGTAFACALAVAAVTTAHRLLGAEKLYGFHALLEATDVSPLANSNNRAGYLNLGFFCGLGLLLRLGRRPLGALLALGLVFLAAEILLCGSRGGTGCFALGFIGLAVLPGNSQPNKSDLGRWTQVAICGAICVGGTLLALTSQPQSFLGLDDRSAEKLDLIQRSARVALDHFGFGVGRGAFASIFSAYEGPGHGTLSEHAENFPLQWAAEWGIPISVAALLSLAWVVAAAFRRRNLVSPTRRCALVGAAALLLQNLVDLGLEVPAVAALLCLVLGALCGASGGRESAGTSIRPSRVLGAASAVASLCWVFAVTRGVDSPTQVRHHLYEQLSHGPVPEAFWSELRAATASYPAEPYFPLLAASAALQSGKNPIPWINRALERSPANAKVYVELARILLSGRATSQAMGALRRAIELDPNQTWTALRLGEQRAIPIETLEAAAPAGSAGAPLLLALAQKAEATSLRLDLLQRSLDDDPAQPNAHHLLAAELLRDVSRAEAGVKCAREREACLASAEQHARLGLLPNNARTGILEADILQARGQPEAAESTLAQTCQQFPNDAPCAEALVGLAVGNGSPRLADAVKAFAALGCATAELCGRSHLRIGDLFAKRQQWSAALTHYREATREAPLPETWTALARAAEALGQGHLATQARRRAQLLEQPGSPPVTDLPPELSSPPRLPEHAP